MTWAAVASVALLPLAAFAALLGAVAVREAFISGAPLKYGVDWECMGVAAGFGLAALAAVGVVGWVWLG